MSLRRLQDTKSDIKVKIAVHESEIDPSRFQATLASRPLRLAIVDVRMVGLRKEPGVFSDKFEAVRGVGYRYKEA